MLSYNSHDLWQDDRQDDTMNHMIMNHITGKNNVI